MDFPVLGMESFRDIPRIQAFLEKQHMMFGFQCFVPQPQFFCKATSRVMAFCWEQFSTSIVFDDSLTGSSNSMSRSSVLTDSSSSVLGK